MTDLETRPENLPSAPPPSAVAVSRRAVAPALANETGPNPYRAHAVGSAVCMGLAGLGAGWSLIQDYTHSDLAVGVFLLTVLLFTSMQGRSLAWEQA
jgi:hypothetical protein